MDWVPVPEKEGCEKVSDSEVWEEGNPFLVLQMKHITIGIKHRHACIHRMNSQAILIWRFFNSLELVGIFGLVTAV